ncbi:5541_t:CDS:1, partial [Gigaspora margarita]
GEFMALNLHQDQFQISLSDFAHQIQQLLIVMQFKQMDHNKTPCVRV